MVVAMSQQFYIRSEDRRRWMSCAHRCEGAFPRAVWMCECDTSFGQGQESPWRLRDCTAERVEFSITVRLSYDVRRHLISRMAYDEEASVHGYAVTGCLLVRAGSRERRGRETARRRRGARVSGRSDGQAFELVWIESLAGWSGSTGWLISHDSPLHLPPPFVCQIVSSFSSQSISRPVFNLTVHPPFGSTIHHHGTTSFANTEI